MTLRQKKQAEKILKGLERQRFADFYAENGEFEEYIQNGIFEKTKKMKSTEKILERIVELFSL